MAKARGRAASRATGKARPKKPGPKQLSGRANRSALAKLRHYVETHTTWSTAKKLGVDQARLQKWFSAGRIPAKHEDTIETLDKPGKRKAVKGIRLATALDRVGPGRLAKITGITAAKLKRMALDEPTKRLPIDQDVFRKQDAAKVAAALKVPKDTVKKAQKKIVGASARRLETLIGVFGAQRASAFLGVLPSTLAKWRKAGQTPAKYRGLLLRAARDEATAREYSARAPRAPTPDPIKIRRRVAEAWRNVAAWNVKKPLKSRLPQKTVELWARTGTFAANWRRYRELHRKAKDVPVVDEAWKKALRGRKTKALLPSKLPRKKRGPAVAKIAEAQIKDFDESVLVAYGDGKFSQYKQPERRYRTFRNEYNLGCNYTWPVEKFVPQIDGSDFRARLVEIIAFCWDRTPGKYKRIYVSLVIASQTEANPFYVESLMTPIDAARFFHRTIDSGRKLATKRSFPVVARDTWDALLTASDIAGLVKLMQCDIKVIGSPLSAPKSAKKAPKKRRY